MKKMNMQRRADICILSVQLLLAAIFSFVRLLDVSDAFAVNKSYVDAVYAICLFTPAFSLAVYGFFRPGYRLSGYLMLVGDVIMLTFAGSVFVFHIFPFFAVSVLFAAQYGSRRMTVVSSLLFFAGVVAAGLLGYYNGMFNVNISLWQSMPVCFIISECVVFLICIPIILRILKIISENAVISSGLIQKSECDGLTGFYNRRKYIEMQEKYYYKADIGIVFWDVDNLKYINDNYGHARGDEVILAVVSAIGNAVSMSGDRVMVYRMGGDEFAAIVEEPYPHELENILSEFEKYNNTEISHNIIASASGGFSYGIGKNTEIILAEADSGMYLRKKEGGVSVCIDKSQMPSSAEPEN